MKKLIILFILSITISSCSNDDNTANTTVLEGDWLLVYQYGGDPPPGQEPPDDISNQNIKYHFKGNIQKITKNDEILHSEITFTLNKKVTTICLVIKTLNLMRLVIHVLHLQMTILLHLSKQWL